ncbi:SsrA-binding protein SmpB [Candidatus Odyssella acanthamoebae]|uniref:SsrA-binding protein n=1 Tax=Candidatus Odyssella acanthamoebae TaxID=91604 RepID=A0A077AWJ0_9PROT|nr:SsrA-binding protein SmpB [Candidatus Paracaedibacter acanthamoebae]AIK96816.1 SsrA-binding protein [Candidatus Paracaedibacter acanthamoebae]
MTKEHAHRIVAQNRRARFDYSIIEEIEAGIVLTGSEVKSLRGGRASINETYAGEMQGEIFLFNANIPIYEQANQFNHEPKRPRKLLLHKRQANKWMGAIQRKGMTLVALSVYFNNKGRAKVALALAKGKNTVDKRATIKERDWSRDKARILRGA